MAVFVIFATSFLLPVTLFSMYQTQELSEPLIFPPTSVEISSDSLQQRLFLQWNVHDRAHQMKLKMVFDIQVTRSENMTIVWEESYNTILRLNENLNWSWHSEFPLECVSHSVRIRSMVDDEQFPASRVWSDWTSWKTVEGQNQTDRPRIFPHTEVVEEGSDISFCCIAAKDTTILSFQYDNTNLSGSFLKPHVLGFTVNNISYIRDSGANIFCILASSGGYDGLVLYIGKAPDEPRHFSCDTKDLTTLNCVWDPGTETHLFRNHSTEYELYEWFSKTKVPCPERNQCVWRLAEDVTQMYNFTLLAKNALGRKSVNLVLNASQRVHPMPPDLISVKDKNATSVTVSWKVSPIRSNPELLCQAEISRNGKVRQFNISHVLAPRSTLTLGELEPYSTYTLRVRCGNANYFWKWSRWSHYAFTTKEAVPSEGPDIWREVKAVQGSRERLLTLFWKPLLDFQANGEILSYDLTVENLDELQGVQQFTLSKWNNSRELTIDRRSYRINITAKNNVGSSPPSVIVVSEDNENDADIKEDRVNGTNGGMNISWEPSSKEIECYVVEWYTCSKTIVRNLQWKKFSSNITRAVISSDDFKPGVRYNFRVYGVSATKESYFLEKKTGYSQEEPPTTPSLVISNLTSSSLILNWSDYPTDESQPGFIKGYHIYMKPTSGMCGPDYEKFIRSGGSLQCKHTIENPERKTFTVQHLRPKEAYDFAISAYTGGGESPYSFINAKTASDDSNLTLIIVLPMILCTLLIITLCSWKIQWAKERCYPAIPDPYKSSVLAEMRFKGGSNLAVLNLNHCVPDALEVMNHSERSKLQLLTMKVQPSQPNSYEPQPGGRDKFTSSSCVCFENPTYSQKESDRDPHLPPRPRSAGSAQSEGETSPRENGSGESPEEDPGVKTSLNYMSQMALPADSDAVPRLAGCLGYKTQMAAVAAPALLPPAGRDAGAGRGHSPTYPTAHPPSARWGDLH